jgi:hypothetical protein
MATQLINEPWQIAEADFPTLGSSEDKLRFLVGYAVLAPSGYNTQPWLFRIGNSHLELFTDRARSLPVVDPNRRELVISCGAALFNLRVALDHFGVACSVTTYPDPNDRDLVAQLSLDNGQDAAQGSNASLFSAITVRRTNRRRFEDRSLPEAVADSLEQAATSEGVWVQSVEDEDSRSALADLVAEGGHEQGADKEFRKELASWLYPRRSTTREGIPGYAFGFGGLTSLAGPAAVRWFGFGRQRAQKDRRLAREAPMLLVLGTSGDGLRDWLAAGQGLQRLLLEAASLDVSASFLNQPIQVANLREAVRSLLGARGFPQLILRLGYGREVMPTPRRHIAQTLLG